MCWPGSVVLAAVRWSLGGLLSSSAPLFLVLGSLGERERESDGLQAEKQKSVTEKRRRGAGLSFVVSAVKAQQGEPPGQFVRSCGPVLRGQRLPGASAGSGALNKPRDKSFPGTRPLF